MKCRGPECENEARESRAYCRGHEEQFYEGRPLTPLRKRGQSLRALLVNAAIRVADAQDNEDFKRAVKLLELIARRGRVRKHLLKRLRGKQTGK